MRARFELRNGAALLCLAVLLVPPAMLAAGCGSTYPLPTELRQRPIPSDKSYQMIATWQCGDASLQTWSCADSVQDLLLTQGTGTQLFILFNHGGAGPAARGDLHLYPLTNPVPLGGIDFPTLFNPVALAAGGDGRGSPQNRVFVLDQGDTTLARVNPITGVYGDTTGGYTFGVTRFDLFWRVREFGLLGGDTMTTFTDTTMAFVRGIAADADGAVYVAGFAIILIADPQDARVFTRVFAPRIYRYLRGPRYPGIVPPDRRMPGSNWHRDSTWSIQDGTGTGYLQDPRGLVWSPAGGRALYNCDFGKNVIQKLSDQSTNVGLLNITTGENALPLYQPVGVGVSADGFIYGCDTGNHHVYRFDANGNYVQRVDHELDAASRPLVTPIAVAVNDSVAYVADRGRNEVIRYKRRP